MRPWKSVAMTASATLAGSLEVPERLLQFLNWIKFSPQVAGSIT